MQISGVQVAGGTLSDFNNSASMERAENGPSQMQTNILLCGTSEAQIKAAGGSQSQPYSNYLLITLRCHGHRKDLIVLVLVLDFLSATY